MILAASANVAKLRDTVATLHVANSSKESYSISFRTEFTNDDSCNYSKTLLALSRRLSATEHISVLSAGPPTEPRNAKTPKVHFRVRKMPFWTPQEKWAQQSIKMSKSPFFDNSPGMDFLDLIDFWAHFFARGSTMDGIFRTLKCTSVVSGFQGSVWGAADCKAMDFDGPMGFPFGSGALRGGL